MSQRPVHEIEARWQAQWEKDQTYRTDDASPAEPFFGLVEFPFPSGAGIHTGHARPYTAIDAFVRRQRMTGKNVLFPIGWDAFGLPTENFAIKNKVRPEDATADNVANFERQLRALGVSFDWTRQVNTTDPNYFRWTQWQFLQFVKHGLAYKAITEINWCPKCKIGLANEEAQGGVCERCGNPVEKRQKSQWMIRITSYADRLLKDLEPLDYTDQVKAQQRNWIGKSEGAHVSFSVQKPDGSASDEHAIEVFTTRPDTLFGVTFLIVSPEMVKGWLDAGWDHASAELKTYVAASLARTETDRSAEGKEKTGADTGLRVINPANGEVVPVWTSDYVLNGYGTGAIMAVPGHDERDFAFATKFGLPVRYVVAPYRPDKTNPHVEGKKIVERKTVQAIIRDPKTGKYLCLKWKKQPWTTFVVGGVEAGEDLVEAARREVLEETGFKNLSFQRVLGGPVRADYYAAHKGENRIAYASAVLFELENDEHANVSEEELENHEVIWLDENELMPQLTCSELDLWLARMKSQKNDLFTDEGYAIASDVLTGLPTWKAKEDMLSWLEEKRVGKKAVTHKLRDWVFSRQRYWGEPIPLVHCDACAKQKQKVLLVHGYGLGSDKLWFPWMKESLERAGFDVIAPMLPDAKHPNFEAWMNALQPHIDQLGSQDIVVGYSMGGKAAIHALARSGKKVGHLILVASPAFLPIEEHHWSELTSKMPGADIEALRAFWAAEKLPVQLDELATDKQFILSSDDPLTPQSVLLDVPEGWFRQVWDGHGHFTDKTEPELLERIIATKHEGWMMLPEASLPLTLPPIDAYEPSDDGESPLATMPHWFNTTCPNCGGPAKRETDTMPNWAGSSWYFLRYCDPHNQERFASKEALRKWMPVDFYNGGMEHTTLHLLYSRFWHKFLWDTGAVPWECGSEPYAKRRSHGLVMASDGSKMSKSKGNIVNPDDIVKTHGADVLRTYISFMGPFDQPVPWDMNGIEGVRKFLDRAWLVMTGGVKPEETAEIRTLYHQTVKKLTEGIDALQFNTCVSQLMILTNAYQDLGGVPTVQREGYLQLLAPFAPHVTEELWSKEGMKGSIHRSAWPMFDAAALVADTYTLVVQVNGKVRGKLELPRAADDEARIRVLAEAEPNVKTWLEGKTIEKVVYVKGRLLNLIVV